MEPEKYGYLVWSSDVFNWLVIATSFADAEQKYKEWCSRTNRCHSKVVKITLAHDFPAIL